MRFKIHLIYDAKISHTIGYSLLLFLNERVFLMIVQLLTGYLIYFSLLILMYSLEKRVSGENKNGT